MDYLCVFQYYDSSQTALQEWATCFQSFRTRTLVIYGVFEMEPQKPLREIRISKKPAPPKRYEFVAMNTILFAQIEGREKLTPLSVFSIERTIVLTLIIFITHSIHEAVMECKWLVIHRFLFEGIAIILAISYYIHMDYRAKIHEIKGQYLSDAISYDEAKKQVEILLVEMNKKGASIAKKFGRNYKKLTFGYVFR